MEGKEPQEKQNQPPPSINGRQKRTGSLSTTPSVMAGESADWAHVPFQEELRELSSLECPIRSILCANRGDIAIRVFRAATELGIRTIAIYSHEDRLGMHRYSADEAYLVGKGKNPVQAYLDMDSIINIAVENDVDAIHPGYGFLSENATFARKVKDAGLIWVGPSPETIDTLGDKTAARKVAIATGVPVVPGTDGPVSTVEEGLKFIEEAGLPVIIKAAMGGGGRGMRVVRNKDEFEHSFKRASAEALAAFGDGTIFIERLVQRPRHIEVQILGDKTGNVIHLFERDCSVQRRHQKVCEIAPAVGLPEPLRQKLTEDAVKLAKATSYENAGTVEFLVEDNSRHYFIEVNPRIQVEHTITEEVTGIDLVQSQILIAGGVTLADLNLHQQSSIRVVGHAIQCRITTEDPSNNFQPQTGKISVYRSCGGPGIRLDGSAGFTGSVITPHYDSLLVKLTAKALTFEATIRKVIRALREMRIRGVKTNIPYLLKLVSHPLFVQGQLWTTFIDETKELFQYEEPLDRAQKLLHYMGDMVVNGCQIPGADKHVSPAPSDPVLPVVPSGHPPSGWRQYLKRNGPQAFAKAIREHKALLLTDTTWRDAHQSLLATRVRTIDLCNIAPATSHLLSPLFSVEMWGGATFDVCLRFLKESPWERLRKLRELVPNIPFQMLLRGANAVGYTSYPDNVVYEFVDKAYRMGVDVFRIFDSLNYVENLKLGIDAVKKAGDGGAVVEAAMCYTGDVSSPDEKKYTLEYYLQLARELVGCGIHILAIKDMAGLLKPEAAKLLIGTLRKEFPDVPIHVHTHDTAGTGVTSMLACAEAGADVVDVAVDSMSGMTSQPSMGAVVASLKGTPKDTGLKQEGIQAISDYWEGARGLYAPFESGLKSGSAGVYIHEMPGGQYTNLQFQSKALGLGAQWIEIKRAYAEANELLGKVVKVTPTSKVVGDLAQFMVQNRLSKEQVLEKASSLSFPSSVVQFFQGYLGEPYQGFPEPLRTHVLKGLQPVKGRPGASMPPLDLAELKQQLIKRFDKRHISDLDAVSAALFPQVFEEYASYHATYGKVSTIPTRLFLTAPKINEEFNMEIGKGKTLYIRYITKSETDSDGSCEVFFEVNGKTRGIRVHDRKAEVKTEVREKANPKDPYSIGAPMGGVVVEIRVEEGTLLKKGDPLLVLSAMKMETVVTSPVSGKVKRLCTGLGDSLAADDLLLEVGAEQE
ncbi:pyruvate carboxylase [Balamuthia mandrillaris]